MAKKDIFHFLLYGSKLEAASKEMNKKKNLYLPFFRKATGRELEETAKLKERGRMGQASSLLPFLERLTVGNQRKIKNQKQKGVWIPH